MKTLEISVQTEGWYDEAKPEEGMRFIKSCGFEGLDYNINDLFKTTFDQENLTSFFDKNMEQLYDYYAPLKKATKEQGLSFSQFHGLFPIYYHGQDDKNRYLIKITEKMMAICAYLDCRAIVVHPWSNPELRKEEEREINLNIYRQLIPAAKKYGVTVCLENMYTKYVNTYHEGACTDAMEACWYIDTLNAEAGEDLFGFCLDVGHANMMGRNIYQYISLLGKRLTTLHIHDNDGSCDAHMMPYTQRCMLGKGAAVDWNGFLKALKEVGYKGPLSFETFRVTDQMPKKVRKEALQLISAIGRYFREELCHEEQ